MSFDQQTWRINMFKDTQHDESEKTKLKGAIERLKESLINKFDKDRHCWLGKQWMNAAVTAEFLILCRYIGYEDTVRMKGAAVEIKGRQNPNGGFSAYYGGPSEISTSCSCYLALELQGEDTASPFMQRIQEYILANGGLERAMLIVKFYYALFGRYSFDGIPIMPVELMFIPKWAGISIYDMSSWARSWLVPLTVVRHYEKLRPRPAENLYKNRGLFTWDNSPVETKVSKDYRQIFQRMTDRLVRGIGNGLLEAVDIKSLYRGNKRGFRWKWREKAIAKARQWLLDHQEADGSWYAVFHSTMISVMALHNFGYTADFPEMKKAIAFILSLQDQSNGRVRQQAFLGPVWDTAIVVQVLLETGMTPDHVLVKQSRDFLLERQSTKIGDWYQKCKMAPGGWGFEFVNEYYPDIDNTSKVLLALRRMGEEPTTGSQVKRGLEWMLAMQNANGSWGAFDRNNNNRFVEYNLRINRYDIGKGKGLILDVGTPDLSAHVLETLAEFDFKITSKPVKKAIKWLKKVQFRDGSWFGRWGLCYLYGTSAVLDGLYAIGEDMRLPYVKKAIWFLRKCQNPDGGFGEAPEAFYDASFRGKGSSTATQTAWVVSALISAGEVNSPEVKRGIDYLIRNLGTDGSYDEKQYQAVAAPPLYQRYELYPWYFPLSALQAYSHAVEKRGR